MMYNLIILLLKHFTFQSLFFAAFGGFFGGGCVVCTAVPLWSRWFVRAYVPFPRFHTARPYPISLQHRKASPGLFVLLIAAY